MGGKIFRGLNDVQDNAAEAQAKPPRKIYTFAISGTASVNGLTKEQCTQAQADAFGAWNVMSALHGASFEWRLSNADPDLIVQSTPTQWRGDGMADTGRKSMRWGSKTRTRWIITFWAGYPAWRDKSRPDYPANTYRRVLCHEIGHTLGLGHKATSVMAIMAYPLSISKGAQTVMPVDIQDAIARHGRR